MVIFNVYVFVEVHVYVCLIFILIIVLLLQQMVVEEGSYSYSMWQKTPIPMYNKIYYFNCTNSQDVMNNGAKPLLKQVSCWSSISKVVLKYWILVLLGFL